MNASIFSADDSESYRSVDTSAKQIGRRLIFVMASGQAKIAPAPSQFWNFSPEERPLVYVN